MSLREAPEWQVAEWLNSTKALSLADFRGRTVVALAFQMLCPGCVSQALPQLQRVADAFPPDQVAVVAIHTVFEHHSAQGRTDVLSAFLLENRIRFPVAIDAPASDGVPLTFRAYAMQGTPTLLLIDAEGRLRMQKFGHIDDLRLGASIATVIAETAPIDAAHVAA
jgi:peroxiredoxin